MILVFFLTSACAPPPPDAAPFAGVLEQLDQNRNGRVDLDEYPAHSPGGAVPAKVDTNGDGEVDATEVRDEVYAVDPASFDKMAWSHSGTKGSAPKAQRPAPGPLAEALRFFADLQGARAPGTTIPTEAEIEAAAQGGMASPAGAVVLARFEAAGLELPSGFAAAPPDPAPRIAGTPPPMSMVEGERLRSDGPGGATALRVPRVRGGGNPPPGAPPPAENGARGDDVSPEVAP